MQLVGYHCKTVPVIHFDKDISAGLGKYHLWLDYDMYDYYAAWLMDCFGSQILLFV